MMKELNVGADQYITQSEFIDLIQSLFQKSDEEEPSLMTHDRSPFSHVEK